MKPQPVGRVPRTGDRPWKHKYGIKSSIQVSNGILTHDLRAWTGEDISLLWVSAHRHRDRNPNNWNLFTTFVLGHRWQEHTMLKVHNLFPTATGIDPIRGGDKQLRLFVDEMLQWGHGHVARLLERISSVRQQEETFHMFRTAKRPVWDPLWRYVGTALLGYT
jgi:hypothetical protein